MDKMKDITESGVEYDDKIRNKVEKTLSEYGLILSGGKVMSGDIQVGYWYGRWKREANMISNIGANILGLYGMDIYSGIEKTREYDWTKIKGALETSLMELPEVQDDVKLSEKWKFL